MYILNIEIEKVMVYEIKQELVCRDIAGVYFIIDPTDKHFYRNKQITSVNSTAYFMIQTMLKYKTFVSDDIVIAVENSMDENTRPTRDVVLNDVNKLITELKNKRWISEHIRN